MQVQHRTTITSGCLSQHASGSAGVTGSQCSRRPAGPTPDSDRHRAGVARWDESEMQLNGQTGYYRIGTFMDSGSSTIRACVGHSLGRAPARCCWWIGRLDARKRHYLLRASVAVNGRSATVYEEVHTLAGKDKRRTHRAFLRQLQAVLPVGCRPIIVTDAGFRTPWFQQVEALGWDWVGRIRNRHKMRWCWTPPTAVINRRPAWPTTWVRQS